jgi:hypothetical protein
MSSEEQLTMREGCANARPGRASMSRAIPKNKNKRSRLLGTEIAWVIDFILKFKSSVPGKLPPRMSAADEHSVRSLRTTAFRKKLFDFYLIKHQAEEKDSLRVSAPFRN